VTNVWDDRAGAYRASTLHSAGADLDLLVEWCEPGPGVTALDVATGGGHVARRLREAGCTVVTCDASQGMEPDVVCRAEALPFDDSSFDVAVNRIAAHHYEDVRAAVRELARVSRGLVVVQDLAYVDDAVEKTEKIRDASHMCAYSEDEWLGFFADAGLKVELRDRFERQAPFDYRLSLTDCEGDEAVRVGQLLAHRIDDGNLRTSHVLFKARTRR
jgi:SAM-dependent methyltransferase